MDWIFSPKSLPNGVNDTFNPKYLTIAPNGNSTSVLSLHLPESLPKKNSTTFTFSADAYVRVNFLKNFPVVHDSTDGSFTIIANNHWPVFQS